MVTFISGFFGMELKYIAQDSIDEDLICSICKKPFVEPVYHFDCGNTFCKKCIQTLQTCSFCNEELSNIMPSPKTLLNQLDKLKVENRYYC